MMLAADHARALRAATGPGALYSELVCARLGVPVYKFHFTGRLEAIYLDGAIGVRIGLPRPVQQHLILHELAHHLMHGDAGGAQFWMRRDRRMLTRIERQAEDFAYLFALPSDELLRRLCAGWREIDLSDYYGRGAEWMHQRCAMEGGL